MKIILVALLVSQFAFAKKVEKKDIKIESPKITDGTFELEKVNHLEGIGALQITVKATRTKKEATHTYYSCTVKDVSGNILKEIQTFALPKEVGNKERHVIPVSSLPDDLKLPILIILKPKYVCRGEECQDVAP